MLERFLLRSEPGPNTLKARPWGGDRLGKLRGLPQPGIGESWEFSSLPGQESYSEGRPLPETLGRPLDVLVKLIETTRALSIQVHPEDDPRSGQLGKEEAWVVLQCSPEAAVWAGLREGIDFAAFATAASLAVRDPSRGDELLACLRCIPLQVGSVVLVPAGTVHAIGPGILLAEIQQPSDCTYRIFDYGSDRPLHLEQAMAALRPGSQAAVWQPDASEGLLTGKHLRLRTLRQGRFPLRASASEPTVIVAVQGEIELFDSGGNCERLSAGELGLAISSCELDASRGFAVLGSCR